MSGLESRWRQAGLVRALRICCSPASTRPAPTGRCIAARADDVLILDNRVADVSVDVVRAEAPALARNPDHDLGRSYLTGLA